MVIVQRSLKQSDLIATHIAHDITSGVGVYRTQTTAHNDRLELLLEAARVQRLVTLRQFAVEDWFVTSVERELEPYRTRYVREGATYGEGDHSMVQWFSACATYPISHLIALSGSSAQTGTDGA